VIVGVLFAGLVAFGDQAERWILYPFDGSHTAPSDASLPEVSEVTLTTETSELILWAAPARHGKPTILYFHGNAGDLADRAGRFRRFLDRGYGLVALAYPGSSGSSGSPNYESLSAAATATHAALSGQGALSIATSSPLIIYGESLGTAVTLDLGAQLSKVPQSDHIRPAAVILEAPFASLAALAEHHYPQIAPYLGDLTDQWHSLDAAKHLRAPLLVVHGSQDDLIPVSQGKAIHDAARSRQKTFLKVKAAGHTDLWRGDTLPRFWRFIDQAKRP
jgi:pimeloyl-ACP methyl ester carboxylesterase